MTKKTLIVIVLLTTLLASCGGGSTPDPALDPMIAMTSAFATVNAGSTQTALAVPTTPPPPPTLTPEPKPTEFIPAVTLQVRVRATANCRFGPSTTYAGPGGVRTGKMLEAIGRDATSQWLLVREAGRKKACWVNLVALEVAGDVNTLVIAPVELIFTPDYPAPPNITAVRTGDQVLISWGDVPLQPQAIYLDGHYFLELWMCNAGQLTYTILGTNDLSITVTDQAGCTEASHGLIYTTTREGYSQPATIPWP